MNTREIILHLSLIKGVGPSLIKTIIFQKPEDLAWNHLYDFALSDWRQLGLSHNVCLALMSGLQDTALLEKELALIATYNIQWLSLLDDEYPHLLAHIHMPPPILFWRGSVTFSKALAVVGSRNTHAYGERVINAIVPKLVQHGYAIVSGGALGADTMAHRAALDAGGKTIVVLGSGLLQPYPYANKRLFEKVVAEGGAVVSSFPSEVSPQSGHFPARNRIISGLSQGVIVVQAAAQSGAKITAQLALEQGRDVFAVPGSVDDPLSAGCHGLIQEGAKLIANTDDILEEYGIPKPVQKTEKNTKKVQKNVQLRAIPTFENPVHEKIVAACVYAQSIDELSAQMNLELGALQKELFALQMDGVVEQDFMGMWKAVY
jgi:DNA processing protein